MANKTSFKKGQSGNPKGRPIGSGELIKRRNEYLSMLMDRCEGKWGKLVDKQLEEAFAGNQQAARFISDHILPKQSPNDYKEDINPMDNLTDEETSKMYDFLLTIIEKENVAKFIENANKVTAFVKEMKAQRLH